jgi:UDP-N-acetylmuramoylalanine--D-glutamate ligase
LVVGLGVTGRAVVAYLEGQGFEVRTYDDKPGLGDVDPAELDAVVGAVDVVVPSPGVPAGHPVYELAGRHDVPVLSEIELASVAASMPLIAVTGTNGKTTVTTIVAAMLVESGITAVAAGNIGLPLIEAIAQPVDAVVAEVSSFQLQYTETFRPAVAVWLNLAEDHLDWHPSLEHYAAAKARIWANQRASEVAVANAEDPAVMRFAATAPGRLVTFGEGGDWHVADGLLTMPDGEVLLPVTGLPRALPHDIANSLAAAAAAVAAGASVDACRAVLSTFQGLPHRVQLVSDAGGVRWYDDSKATTPASVVAALKGFDSAVLIAGGRNKGLDLGALRAGVSSVKAVVAIGDAAREVVTAFDGLRPVQVADSMDEAVALAADLAGPGDVVLLSPGCASFDWYTSYAQRGDDFARAVRQRVEA